MRMTFNIDLPDHDLRVGTDDRLDNRFFPLIICLEALSQVNEWQLTRRNLPSVYEVGIAFKRLRNHNFYQAEEIGDEDWLDIPHLYSQGFGDCEDLSCARVAELRFAGVKAKPCIKFKSYGQMTLVHVMVEWPDGSIEDPSAKLGMRGEYQ